MALAAKRPAFMAGRLLHEIGPGSDDVGLHTEVSSTEPP
jgi:hypothetical protein